MVSFSLSSFSPSKQLVELDHLVVGSSYFGSSTPVEGLLGSLESNVLTWDLGMLEVPCTSSGALVFVIFAEAAGNSSLGDGDTLNFVGTLTYGQTVDQSVTLEVVEPELVFTLEPNTILVTGCETVIGTSIVEHTGSSRSSAVDLVLLDSLGFAMYGAYKTVDSSGLVVNFEGSPVSTSRGVFDPLSDAIIWRSEDNAEFLLGNTMTSDFYFNMSREVEAGTVFNLMQQLSYVSAVEVEFEDTITKQYSLEVTSPTDIGTMVPAVTVSSSPVSRVIQIGEVISYTIEIALPVLAHRSSWLTIHHSHFLESVTVERLSKPELLNSTVPEESPTVLFEAVTSTDVHSFITFSADTIGIDLGNLTWHVCLEDPEPLTLLLWGVVGNDIAAVNGTMLEISTDLTTVLTSTTSGTTPTVILEPSLRITSVSANRTIVDADDAVGLWITIEHDQGSSGIAYGIELFDILVQSSVQRHRPVAVVPDAEDGFDHVPPSAGRIWRAPSWFTLEKGESLTIFYEIETELNITETPAYTLEFEAVYYSVNDTTRIQHGVNRTYRTPKETEILSPQNIDLTFEVMHPPEADPVETRVCQKVEIKGIITIPEGNHLALRWIASYSSNNLIHYSAWINVTAPSALSYDCGSGASVDWSALIAENSLEVALSEASAYLTLCSVSNADSDNAVSENVEMTVEGYVLDNLGVSSGSSVQLRGWVRRDVSYSSSQDNSTGSLVTSATYGYSFQVVEPVLTIESSTPSAVNVSGSVDGNDVVEYSFVIKHALGSTSEAVSLILRDAQLASGVSPRQYELQWVEVEKVGSVGGPVWTESYWFDYNGSHTVVTWSSETSSGGACDTTLYEDAVVSSDGVFWVQNECDDGHWDLVDGDELVVRYVVRVVSDIESGSSITPDISLEYSSMRVSASDRYDGCQRVSDASWAGPTLDVSEKELSLEVVHPSTDGISDVSIRVCQLARFNTTVSFPEGHNNATRLVTMFSDSTVMRVEPYPLGWQSISASSALSYDCGSGASVDWSALIAENSLEVALSEASAYLTLCSVSNADSDNAVSENVEVTVEGYVLDNLGVSSGSSVQLRGWVRRDVSYSSSQDNSTGSLVTSATYGYSFQVVEPVLTIESSTPSAVNVSGSVDGNDVVEYSFVIKHALGSTSEAVSLILRDAQLASGVSPRQYELQWVEVEKVGTVGGPVWTESYWFDYNGSHTVVTWSSETSSGGACDTTLYEDAVVSSDGVFWVQNECDDGHWDLVDGDELVVRYVVRVVSDIESGSSITPDISLEYSSMRVSASDRYDGCQRVSDTSWAGPTLDVSEKELSLEVVHPSTDGISDVSIRVCQLARFNTTVSFPEGHNNATRLVTMFSDSTVMRVEPYPLGWQSISASSALSYDCGSGASVDWSALIAENSLEVALSEASAYLTLCSVSNTDSDNAVSENVEMTVEGYVLDNLGVSSGSSVQLRGWVRRDVSYSSSQDNSTGSLVTSATYGYSFQVVEPVLTIESSTPSAVNVSGSVDGNDVVEYSFVIKHGLGSTSEAVSLILRDAQLASGVSPRQYELQWVEVEKVGTVGGPVWTESYWFDYNGSHTVVTWSSETSSGGACDTTLYEDAVVSSDGVFWVQNECDDGHWDLVDGDELVVRYVVRVVSDIESGSSITPDISLEYSSMRVSASDRYDGCQRVSDTSWAGPLSM